jgi:hypothetical protein
LCIFAALPFPVSFFDEWPLNPKWLTLETWSWSAVQNSWGGLWNLSGGR